eukprot:4281732-Amphidinium_carterae.2
MLLPPGTSDHLPILVRIEESLRQPVLHRKRKWRLKGADYTQLQTKVRSALPELSEWRMGDHEARP